MRMTGRKGWRRAREIIIKIGKDWKWNHFEEQQDLELGSFCSPLFCRRKDVEGKNSLLLFLVSPAEIVLHWSCLMISCSLLHKSLSTPRRWYLYSLRHISESVPGFTLVFTATQSEQDIYKFLSQHHSPSSSLHTWKEKWISLEKMSRELCDRVIMWSGSWKSFRVSGCGTTRCNEKKMEKEKVLDEVRFD